MKKSVIKIIINIAIILVVLILPFYIVMFKDQSGNTVENKKVVIDIDEENIEVKEDINLKMSDDAMSLNLQNMIDVKHENMIKSISVDNKVESYKNYVYRDYEIRNTTGQNMTKNIKVNYILGENYIKKYTDLSCLKLTLCPPNIDYAKNIDITIHFNKPSKIFEVENKRWNRNIVIDKISDTEYTLHIKKASFMKNNEIVVMFDNSVTNVGEVQNESYELQNEIEKEEFKKENKYVPIFWITSIITTVSYIIYFIFADRKPKVHEVKRDFEGLVSPVLAETINDGKIGIKELIMTVVVDLVTRGNIEVINNESIRLLNRNNLTIYEHEVVNLLFKEKNSIYFSEFKDMFIKINTKTKDIYINIGEIKNDIIEELVAKGILSKEKKRCMDVLRGIISINIFIVFITVSGLISLIETKIPLICIMILILLIVSKQNKTLIEKIETINHTRKSAKLKMLIITSVIMIVAGLLWNMSKAPIWNIVFAVIIILDVAFLFMTKRQFFTSKGKEERKKVLQLKKYLVEYSIMRQRDLQEVVLWDKYLAYATAFGIPNNVTKKMYEEYMNVNIALQTIEKMVKIF